VSALDKLASEYRPTMDREVLHSWAKDIVAALSQPQAGEPVEPLGADFEAVWDKNAALLYERDPVAPQPALAVEAEPPLTRTIENQTKETHVPKLTSAIALELVTRIEALNDQITDVYREAGEYDGINNINVIRDIVKAREEASDQKMMADGMLESFDEDEE